MATTAVLKKPSTVARTSVPAQPPKLSSIGDLIDSLHTMREAKRALEAQIKTIEADVLMADEALQERFNAEGIDASRGKLASASISTSVVGVPTDWEAFCAWARKKNYMHLFFRRASDPALRELWEQGVVIPGVDKFLKKKLNVRSL